MISLFEVLGIAFCAGAGFIGGCLIVLYLYDCIEDWLRWAH